MPKDEADIVAGCLRKFTTKVVKKLGRDLITNLSNATPVDTGYASVNWLASIGVDSDRTAGERPTKGVASRSELLASLALIASSKDLLDKTLYINNNVHYIVKLNEGSSSQAPALFVDSVVESTVRKLER